MTFEQIMNDLKNKIYKPFYFLYGEEPYYIDVITNYISTHILTDTEKNFNQTILYGKDTDIKTIVSIARRYPMMANYQVVIVKEAQNIKNIEDLSAYLDNYMKSTILVINYKYNKLDKRKKFFKDLEKKGVVFESEKKWDKDIPEWITQYLKNKNLVIEPSVCILLSEYLGTDLSRIANELDKLAILLPAGTKITIDHIEKNIGISKEYNTRELQFAIAEKNITKVNRIVYYLSKNVKENPIKVSIGVLFNFFSQLLVYHYLKKKKPNCDEKELAGTLGIQPKNLWIYTKSAKYYPPQRLFDIIAILREYDLKAKGLDNGSATESDLYKEMVYKILN